eukprot:NODE_11688_length_201_cov_14.828947_g11073_i0.p2 GENE.NODE_11688_length_201_cov_14.828947_g11073_i0~~NODE_11688_length_201_cov_14.828947_g11073_i0.p2  ORF type:complete len:56 (-),score=21.20 NODE_11688_length_201_cov_14.828947_g11073_i0:32-175(-)
MGVHIPDTPFYWILNTAVRPPPLSPDPTSVFPVYHTIDYVKAFTWKD